MDIWVVPLLLSNLSYSIAQLQRLEKRTHSVLALQEEKVMAVLNYVPAQKRLQSTYLG